MILLASAASAERQLFPSTLPACFLPQTESTLIGRNLNNYTKQAQYSLYYRPAHWLGCSFQACDYPKQR